MINDKLKEFGLDLKDRELEEFALNIFKKMGFKYVLNSHQNVSWESLDPNNSLADDANLELDFLIPLNKLCLIGEIKGGKNAKDIRGDFRKFCEHYDRLIRLNRNNKFWKALQVPEELIHLFQDITTFKGFFISTNTQHYELDLPDAKEVVPFYRPDWMLLRDYAETIGDYGRLHFLNALKIDPFPRKSDLMIKPNEPYFLRVLKYKTIATTKVAPADIFTFEISPYDLLDIAKVYRRDFLPNLADLASELFQRPLITSKLNIIRTTIKSEPNFMFPTSILVVLSEGCTYNDHKMELTIPGEYGAVSVIDGQHRLFSYASAEVQRIITERHHTPKILVTAIKFRTDNLKDIKVFSARTFIEINNTQTPIPPDFIKALQYPLFENTASDNLAIHILSQSNRKSQILSGLLYFNKYSTGLIKISTVARALARITNLERIKKALNQPQPIKTLQGYENLIAHSGEIVKVEDLLNPETLVKQTSICLDLYFTKLASVFKEDWPLNWKESERDVKNPKSALGYTRMIAAFIMLLEYFIDKGSTWVEVTTDLGKLKKRLLKLQNLPSHYSGVIFSTKDAKLPDSTFRESQMFYFLKFNIESVDDAGVSMEATRNLRNQ